MSNSGHTQGELLEWHPMCWTELCSCPHWLEYAASHWHQSTTSPLSQQEMPGSADFQGGLLGLWVARWCLHIFVSPWESTGWFWWALGWAVMLQQPANADQQFQQGMLQHRGCVSGETESKGQGIDRCGVTLGVIRYSSDVGFRLVLSVLLCMRKSCLVSTWIQGYPGSGAGRAEWIFIQARHQLRYTDCLLCSGYSGLNFQNSQ